MRRAMILTMLSYHEALTVNQIWRRTPNGSRQSAVRMVKAMVRQGLAKSRVVKKADDQTNKKYVLTGEGKMVALAVAYESESNPLGISYREILEELSQPEPKREAVDVLHSYWALNMLSRGMTGAVMEALHEYVKETETKGKFVSPAYFMLKLLPKSGSQVRQVSEAFVQAFQALTGKEQAEAMQYAKGVIQSQMEEVARVTENKKLFEDATESMKDPTKIVFTNISKKCWSCGEPINELRFRPDALYKAMTTRETSIPCPHCGANLITSEDLKKLDETNFREIAEKMMKRAKFGMEVDLPQTNDDTENSKLPPEPKSVRKRRI